MNGDVHIELPANLESGRMAEIAAVHAANSQGFPPNAVSDLRQAIQDAVSLLLDPELAGGSMAFDYLGKAGIVTVEAQIHQPGSRPIAPGRIDRFESAAGPLVDSWKLDPDEHRLWLQKSG